MRAVPRCHGTRRSPPAAGRRVSSASDGISPTWRSPSSSSSTIRPAGFRPRPRKPGSPWGSSSCRRPAFPLCWPRRLRPRRLPRTRSRSPLPLSAPIRVAPFVTASHTLTRAGVLAILKALKAQRLLSPATANALIKAAKHGSRSAFLRAAHSTSGSVQAQGLPSSATERELRRNGDDLSQRHPVARHPPDRTPARPFLWASQRRRRRV